MRGAREISEGGGGGAAAAAEDDDDNRSIVTRATTRTFATNKNNNSNSFLSEQDVYAAADSLEIIRDAHSFFLERREWKSSSSALGNLERVHRSGVEAMSLLFKAHLTNAGAAVRLKRIPLKNNERAGGGKKGDHNNIASLTFVGPSAHESATEARTRFSAALENRELMKSVGEYREHLPLDTRKVRELRAIVECLMSGTEGGENGQGLLSTNVFPNSTTNSNLSMSGSDKGTAVNRLNDKNFKVVRTEKIGSGFFCNIIKQPFKSKFSHLNAYVEARKDQATTSLEGYYRHLRNERKKFSMFRRDSIGGGTVVAKSTVTSAGEVDSGARDTVRCLEHAMVVVQGEKSIYRCVLFPTTPIPPDASTEQLEYKSALLQAYSHVVSAVVDRVLDIIEFFFAQDAGLGYAGNPSSSDSTNGEHDSNAGSSKIPSHSVLFSGSSAVAGLRILDGVRMLGPSLAKLCDMLLDKNETSTKGHRSKEKKDPISSLASNLCIAIHRTTVKNAAHALEMLVNSVHKDPLQGEKYRSKNAGVAPVSSDTVRAVRLISPFVNAYKSVSKRRALPWDPHIGEKSKDLNSYIKFLIMRLINNLQRKAQQYKEDGMLDSEIKCNLFLMNNSFYLMEQLGAQDDISYLANEGETTEEEFKISDTWFFESVSKQFERAKSAYLESWNVLNQHLTKVNEKNLEYQSDKLLSLESGRLLKARFSGFNADFEKMYSLHSGLFVADAKLHSIIVKELEIVFFKRYKKFYDTYSKIQFSKKKMEEYLKYQPKVVERMLQTMYSSY